MKLRNLGALGASVLIVAGACTAGAPATNAPSQGGSAAPSSRGTIKIGVTFPLSGGARADGGPALRGAELAIAEANAAGGVGGYTLELSVLDHAVNGQYNEQQGANDLSSFVNDPSVIAVIGPYNSAVARVQIPIGNDAGLLQCSPANTNEGLTKPEFGALDFRPNFPERINYIRVATTDDVQGPAMAGYAYNDLSLRDLLVVDDVTTFGDGVADNFQAEFEDLGGTVAQRVPAPVGTGDFNGILDADELNPDGEFAPDGVYYGGIVTSGGGLLLKQLRQKGITVPFLGPDGIKNGSGEDEGALIQIATAELADNTYATVAAIGDFPAKADFDARYAAEFADAEDFKTPGAYSGPAYACGQVILKSIEEAATGDPADMAALREAVRAYATDSSNSFETILGTTAFDENGDTTQKIISFYDVDPTLLDGAGDWVFVEQQDFGQSGG